MTYNAPESGSNFDNTQTDVIRGRVVSDLELEAMEAQIQDYLEGHFYVGQIPLSIVGPDNVNFEHNPPMCEICIDGVHYPQAVLWEHKELQDLLGIETQELLLNFEGDYLNSHYRVRVITTPD